MCFAILHIYRDQDLKHPRAILPLQERKGKGSPGAWRAYLLTSETRFFVGLKRHRLFRQGTVREHHTYISVPHIPPRYIPMCRYCVVPKRHELRSCQYHTCYLAIFRCAYFALSRKRHGLLRQGGIFLSYHIVPVYHTCRRASCSEVLTLNHVSKRHRLLRQITLYHDPSVPHMPLGYDILCRTLPLHNHAKPQRPPLAVMPCCRVPTAVVEKRK